MGRYISCNAPVAPGGVAACILGNSTATVCGSFCGDGRNICNVGACSSSGVGCVWQPIDVCCCWTNTVCGFKCFLYNFSCWSMIKLEFNGMARCDYDSCFKVLADSTNCDLSSNPNTYLYCHRYIMNCWWVGRYECDVVCLMMSCNTTGCSGQRAGLMTVCLFPITHGYAGCNCTPHIGGKWESIMHDNGGSGQNWCSFGQWSPIPLTCTGMVCYPLCCVVNCCGLNFNRLRISNGNCRWSACEGGAGGVVPGAYYGLWGMPRQTVALVPPAV